MPLDASQVHTYIKRTRFFHRDFGLLNGLEFKLKIMIKLLRCRNLGAWHLFGCCEGSHCLQQLPHGQRELSESMRNKLIESGPARSWIIDCVLARSSLMHHLLFGSSMPCQLLQHLFDIFRLKLSPQLNGVACDCISMGQTRESRHTTRIAKKAFPIDRWHTNVLFCCLFYTATKKQDI